MSGFEPREQVTVTRKSNPLLPALIVLIVLFVALAGLCVKLWLDKTAAEQQVAEYKDSYDALIEEMEEAEIRAEEYQAKYNQLAGDMLNDAVIAENMGNLTISVWHNAIFGTRDDETDPYTMENGAFVSDFNDALGNLFNDEEFMDEGTTLYSNQLRIQKEMKEMLNPPEGFENAFKALESMYNSYITFTNIVLNCNGSLESFSNDFGEADEDFVRKYEATELYVK